jgi:hypothetical protein
MISSFVTFLTDKHGEDFWIGANDKDLEGDWVWESDKSKLLFSDWHVDEPSTDGDCAEIRWDQSLYRWNDIICSDFNLYICEK